MTSTQTLILPEKNSSTSSRLSELQIKEAELREYEQDLVALLFDFACQFCPCPQAPPPAPLPPVSQPIKEPESPIEGLEVTRIDVKSRIKTGDAVPVYVTVYNLGAYPEKAELTLTDKTENTLIGREIIVVKPHAYREVCFYWKTKWFSLGSHILDAQAGRL